MNKAAIKPLSVMPKGGRKGGSIFPRISLENSLIYAKKLVSKTHVSAQPKDIIFSGVLGAKGGKGNVKISAMKQYGFIKIDAKSNFYADDLAKKIDSSPPEGLLNLYRQAILKPVIFKKLYETFHGDEVSKARLKQRAADFKVHPEECSACVDLYIAGMKTAGLVIQDGDLFRHLSLSDNNTNDLPLLPESLDDSEVQEESITSNNDDEVTQGNAGEQKGKEFILDNDKKMQGASPKAVFNVNVTLDSSLDIEKLQKQLELLKRYGAI